MDDKKTAEKNIPVIELGGLTWFLKITHRVLERFSAISRVSLTEFEAVLTRYDMMTLLLWIMMCETRQDLTREGLNGWLNAMPPLEAMTLVSNAVAEALSYSFPQPAEDASKDADEEKLDKNPTDAEI